MENIRNFSSFIIITVLFIIFGMKIQVWTHRVQNYNVIGQ